MENKIGPEQKLANAHLGLDSHYTTTFKRLHNITIQP